MKIVGALIGVLGFAAVAHADDIKLGVPGYGGSGCPSNSVSATLSPDSKSLSLLFDEYIVQAGGDTGKSLDRKTCNVAIPVHVPQGRSVSVLAIDYRGFNQLPRGARSHRTRAKATAARAAAGAGARSGSRPDRRGRGWG